MSPTYFQLDFDSCYLKINVFLISRLVHFSCCYAVQQNSTAITFDIDYFLKTIINREEENVTQDHATVTNDV